MFLNDISIKDIAVPHQQALLKASRRASLQASNANFVALFQLPLGLLNAAQGHPMLVELKNGETLNGHLVNCDTWMNLTLKEVVQTSPVRRLPLRRNRAGRFC